jgi:protein arginine kinase activator
MLCEICYQKTATVKISQIVNGQKKETNMCKSCAEKKGLSNPFSGLPDVVGSLILGILTQGLTGSRDKEIDTSLICSRCGLSIGQFEKTGVLGCSDCYKAFEEPLRNLLRRIHGSNKHIGGRPVNFRRLSKADDIKTLRDQLNNAIESEDYEKAAGLRDVIRDMEYQKRQNENQNQA